MHIEGMRRRQDEAYQVAAHLAACVLTALSPKRRRIRGEDILRLRARGSAPSRAQLEEMFRRTVEMMGPCAKPVKGGGSDGRSDRPGGR